MASSNIKIPSAKAIISAAASFAAAVMVVRSATKDFVPHEFEHFIYSKFRRLFSGFSNEITIVIEEFDGLNPNHLFLAADIYLGAADSYAATTRFRATKLQKEHQITLSMERNEQMTDTFDGIKLNWRMACNQIPLTYVSDPDNPYGSTTKSELRFFELSFHKRYKNQVISQYLPYVLEKSKLVKEEQKTLKIFTMKKDRVMGMKGWNPWQSVNLDHPATFETLAMDVETKMEIMEDLERFVKRKDFYRKVGKAWKRGYLLFGPPGTGKSSLIAAMANYLKFDVYDLELTDLRSNSELRNLLVSTANQSILVVEDIDCSIELQDRLAAAAKSQASMAMHPFRHNQQTGITLSGLLNFIDGLWSSCGDERIIVFTTNHKDKLDSALLRPGRMDVHIHMSYCTPCGFKLLASNYLGITDHPLLKEAEILIEIKRVTPAEVGEQLMKNEEPDFALRGLIEFLKAKKESEGNEACEMELKACESDVKLENLQEGESMN